MISLWILEQSVTHETHSDCRDAAESSSEPHLHLPMTDLLVLGVLATQRLPHWSVGATELETETAQF